MSLYPDSPNYPSPNYQAFGATIGNLLNTYRQGQQYKQQHDLSQAFQGGVPTDPVTGAPDYNKIMQVLAQKGDINAIGQLGPLAAQQQQVPMSPLLGGSPVAGAPTGGATPPTGAPLGPGATVPAIPRIAQPQPAAAPQAPVTNVPAPGGAMLGDLSGASSAFPSVSAMVSSAVPDTAKAGTVSANIAKAIKVDPTQPLTQDQADYAKRILAGYMQRNAPASGGATLGARNNNPDNIENGAYAARQPGYEGAGEGGRFAKFDTPEAGLDAASNLIGIYGRKGINTIAGITATWAPASEKGNDPRSYAATVSKALGVDPNQPLDLSNADTRRAIASAMSGVESPGALAPGGGNLPPASAAAGIPTRPPGNQVADNSAKPIGPQVPLPPGFTDPQQAILAIDKEMARLSVYPRAEGQVAALKDWRDRIEKSSALMEVRPGETLLDPRTGQVAFQGSPTNANNIALQRFLEAKPDATPQEIQAFVQSGRSSRSAASAYINRYLQENPDATANDVAKAAQDYTKQSSAITKFTSGVQGNTVRSFNVLIDHLGVLNDAIGALKNGDLRSFNQLSQAYAVQTGSPAPTNFDSVKSIVGDELVKAIVGGVATIGDREEVKKNIDRANSPEQLVGAIEQYRRLAIGQLHGLQKQYETATGRDDFNDLLSPGTRSFFEGQDKKAAPQSATPAAAAGKPDKDGWVTLPGGNRIREAQ